MDEELVEVFPEPLPVTRKNLWIVAGETEDGRLKLVNEKNQTILICPRGCCRKLSVKEIKDK